MEYDRIFEDIAFTQHTFKLRAKTETYNVSLYYVHNTCWGAIQSSMIKLLTERFLRLNLVDIVCRRKHD